MAPKIGLKHGITLPGPVAYSSIRVDIEMTDLDLGENLESQIEECIQALALVDAAAQGEVAKQASELSGVEMINQAAVVNEFMDKMRAWAKGVNAKLDGVQTPQLVDKLEPTKTAAKRK